MIITIYNFDTSIMQISSDGINSQSKWIGPRHIKIPRYLYPENITPQGISKFCETRQPPRTRFDIDRILKIYGLREYLPIQMCRISHGITHEDDLWMLFEGQVKPKYADITVR